MECIELKTLDTLDVDKMILSIKDIFDFGDNKIYQYFFEHLKNNIKEYIQHQYKAKAVKSFYVLDIEKLTDIVKYCITHGFDEKAAKEKDKAAAAAAAAKNKPPPPPPKKVEVQIKK